MPSAISRSMASFRRLCSGRLRVMRATPLSERSFTNLNSSGVRFAAVENSWLAGSIIGTLLLGPRARSDTKRVVETPNWMLARHNRGARMNEKGGAQRVEFEKAGGDGNSQHEKTERACKTGEGGPNGGAPRCGRIPDGVFLGTGCAA